MFVYCVIHIHANTHNVQEILIIVQEIKLSWNITLLNNSPEKLYQYLLEKIYIRCEKHINLLGKYNISNYSGTEYHFISPIYKYKRMNLFMSVHTDWKLNTRIYIFLRNKQNISEAPYGSISFSLQISYARN